MSSEKKNPVLPSPRCSYTLNFGIKKKQITRNFVRENIVDVVKKVPPLPKHRVQDTRNGHIMDLDKAGLEPTYVSKKVLQQTQFIY